jgi:hypothetical protein
LKKNGSRDNKYIEKLKFEKEGQEKLAHNCNHGRLKEFQIHMMFGSNGKFSRKQARS